MALQQAVTGWKVRVDVPRRRVVRRVVERRLTQLRFCFAGTKLEVCLQLDSRTASDMLGTCDARIERPEVVIAIVEAHEVRGCLSIPVVS